MLSLFLLALLALVLALLRPFLLLLWRQHRSPLRHLPGPPSRSLFLGNLEEMHDQENNNLIARWAAAYGPAFVYRGFLCGPRLMLTDPVAIAHVLGNAYDYPKPDFVRDSLAAMAAGHDGLLTVEGDAHRRQRKILTPAFSASHIKSLTPIFWDKATELRDIWLEQLDHADADPASGRAHSVTRVDALAWLGRATLDVIGLAGFGYRFDALTDDTNELARAFGVIFATARRLRLITILQAWFPFLRRFRRNNATMAHAQATMRRIGLALIDEKRRAAALEAHPKHPGGPAAGKDGPTTTTAAAGTSSSSGRDILSVLVRANLASDPAARLSAEETLCQISTFLAAGHETTASALTWCLYALARDRAVQARLRAALRGVAHEKVDEKAKAENEGDREDGALTARVARCEYLDWVVRESLRLHAPVTSTMRVCMRAEDAVPLQARALGGGCAEADAGKGKGKGKGTDGGEGEGEGTRTSVRVRRGDIVSIPIQAVNRGEAAWGADAGVFRPERWAAPPPGARAIPGLYANTLTFLNGNPLGGNRACIGYKFALIEIKIFLYVLIKDIDFSMDPAMVIEKKVNVVTRPFVKSEPHLGNQMPLDISRPLGAPSAHAPGTSSA